MSFAFSSLHTCLLTFWRDALVTPRRLWLEALARQEVCGVGAARNVLDIVLRLVLGEQVKPARLVVADVALLL